LTYDFSEDRRHIEETRQIKADEGFRSLIDLDRMPGPDAIGDWLRRMGISKRGNRYIRSVLYGCVTAAIRGGRDPPAGRLFDRLKAKGKHREPLRSLACSGLLAIVYGCWSNGERFDPQYEERLKARQKEKNQDGQNDSGQTTSGGRNLSAPVSKREATLRKKAPMPQKSGSSSDRGQHSTELRASD
jgi:hypothetical protein